jgi:hypothetical protein
MTKQEMAKKGIDSLLWGHRVNARTDSITHLGGEWVEAVFDEHKGASS